VVLQEVQEQRVKEIEEEMQLLLIQVAVMYLAVAVVLLKTAVMLLILHIQDHKLKVATV
jgi:hypothetical protein